jgi:hypothetical protein
MSKTAKKFLGVALLWFLLALGVGKFQLLAWGPPPLIQIILLVLSIILLITFWKSFSFRNWVQSLGLRPLILVHLTRFVGIYFLFLYSQGKLPYAFAVPGGWGDTFIATMALLLAFLSFKKPRTKKIVLVWNLLGLIDILGVVLTAAKLGLENPASVQALTHLPLSLLPTFFVPLIIASHLIIFFEIFHNNWEGKKKVKSDLMIYNHKE